MLVELRLLVKSKGLAIDSFSFPQALEDFNFKELLYCLDFLSFYDPLLSIFLNNLALSNG
ncbi:unnamed protein product [Moneuplotes crassus]|uniref:Uncharacterized protein n=1 Tax=Euplotes crassus TaxID=5936 RepID=A0AAD1XSY6_EUPCR|nr:unnamed protein product [Moneuplotes crassus]